MLEFRALQPLDPRIARDIDLRRWRSQFPDVTALADAEARRRATFVGVVHKIRLVPGKSLEVDVEDGSGRLTGVWSGRTDLPGLQLGAGLRLTGTVAVDSDGSRRILNPEWALVSEPYA